MSMRFSESVYFRGFLVFDEEPDWDVFVKACEVYPRLGSEARRTNKLEFGHAEVLSDGTCRIPFVSEGVMELFREEDRRRVEMTAEEAQEAFFEKLGERIESFFGCSMEAQVLRPDFAHVEDLEAVQDYLSKPNRGGFPGLFGRASKLKAEDVRPQLSAAGGDPFAELEALIGLESVKHQVNDIVRVVRNHGRKHLPGLHMVFRGNPGTGKTTVARLIARIFDEEGVTSGDGVFVETDRGGLCGKYVGHTADLTRRVIDSAMGGVLFVDEAYALGMYDSHIDYGQEAISTLVKALEDKRDEFVCILAGYPVEMDKMIDVNPGMRDRISFYVDFPDYSAAELAEIFHSFAAADDFRMSSAASELVEASVECAVAHKGDNFSNARIVRKLYERVRMAHMVDSATDVLGIADVRKALADEDMAALFVEAGAKAVTGFC